MELLWSFPFMETLGVALVWSPLVLILKIHHVLSGHLLLKLMLPGLLSVSLVSLRLASVAC